MECGADDDTNRPSAPPQPPLQGASSSCLVVVRFSVLCRITWGGDNPALVGSGAGWDRQGCQGGDVHPMLKAREKETDRRKSERKEKKTEILQKLIHSAKKQQLVLSYSPTLPFLNIIQSFFLSFFFLSFSLPSCFGSLSFAAPLSCKLKLVSAELLILVSVY